MKKINLTITGCLGRMGQQLIKSQRENKDFKVVSLTENKLFQRKLQVLNLKSILSMHLKKQM